MLANQVRSTYVPVSIVLRQEDRLGLSSLFVGLGVGDQFEQLSSRGAFKEGIPMYVCEWIRSAFLRGNLETDGTVMATCFCRAYVTQLS